MDSILGTKKAIENSTDQGKYAIGLLPPHTIECIELGLSNLVILRLVTKGNTHEVHLCGAP